MSLKLAHTQVAHVPAQGVLVIRIVVLSYMVPCAGTAANDSTHLAGVPRLGRDNIRVQRYSPYLCIKVNHFITSLVLMFHAVWKFNGR